MVMQASCVTIIKHCELYKILRRPMQLCRGAGLFPVEGLDVENIIGLRFNVKSMYALYFIVTLLGQIVISSFATFYFFTNDLDLESLKCLLFYVTGLISAIFLSNLAKDFPQLIKKASYLENRVASVSTKRKRYDFIVFAMLLLALLEHILSITFQVKFVMACNHDVNIDLIRKYFSKIFIFKLTSYTGWKAVLYEIVNLQSTFLWNIADAITMCISLYLTSYFNDLNRLIENQQKQNLVNWKEIRLYYSYLVELVSAVDQSMCYLILMSFFTNLFFICVQLFHLTNYSYPVLSDCTQDEVKSAYTSIEHSLYYASSFIFLFTRACLSSLLAAKINTVARKPLLILQNVSSSEYTIEVQRFIRQIRYTTTALSGVCFYITRGMILTVVATVIKYELVILQFNPIK